MIERFVHKMLMEKTLARFNLGRGFLLFAFCCALLWQVSYPCNAADDSFLDASSRRTSVRFLRLAEKYCDAGDYNTANATADMGIGYCSDVSDLWYIKAHSASEMGYTRAEVLPLVERALKTASWVDYNKDKARVLYADLLCDVGRYSEAQTALDEEPYIYSADAQFIRAKSYYRQGAIEAARRKVDDSRKMYPEDTRFPLLFFRYERALQKGRVLPANKNAPSQGESSDGGMQSEGQVSDESSTPKDSSTGDKRAKDGVLEDDELTKSEPSKRNPSGGKLPASVVQTANAFIARLSTYKDCSDELFLLAAMSADDAHRKQMLESFAQRLDSHALPSSAVYALAALHEGMMEPLDGVECFFSYDVLSMYDIMELLDIIENLGDDAAHNAVKAHLSAYNGLLSIDTTGDIEPNLFVKYSNGKISAINYDNNNDGISEWVAKCDGGVPDSLELDGYGKRLKTEVGYGVYPSVTSVTLVTGKIVSFSLVEDTYLWSPFEIVPLLEGYDFFVPAVLDVPPLDVEALVKASWKCTMPIDERDGSTVTYTMLDGLRQTSLYSSHGVVYARGTYKDGLPDTRVIDGDGDGVFETTERYSHAMNTKKTEGAATEGAAEYMEEEEINRRLFTDDVYVSRVEVDLDEDTVSDFVEEYTEDGGKISTWDQDADGQWDVRYERRTNSDGLIEEKAHFFAPPKSQAVCVESVGGEPKEVSIGETSYAVTKGAAEGMYWIGDAGEKEDEDVVSMQVQSMSQGKRILAEHNGKRIFAVRIGDKCYAVIVRDIKEESDASGGSEGSNVQEGVAQEGETEGRGAKEGEDGIIEEEGAKEGSAGGNGIEKGGIANSTAEESGVGENEKE